MLEDDFHLLAEFGILASAQQAVDPMEVALHELGDDHASSTIRSRQLAGWTLDHHYPLDPGLLAMTHVWGSNRPEDERIVATKGAPEAIVDLCGLSGEAKEDVRRIVDSMARNGLRVLGVADARWSGADLPASQRDFDFTFRGLVGLADPLRPSVPEAVLQCRRAGIRIIMITGDYPQTARAIAEHAGIATDDILTGEQVAVMDDAELGRRIASVNVFARIMPEQKLRLVEALKNAGEVVAMTGDGVNDAPSLKAAHIGIAMGGRGTDVAREAAAIVLLDDDFGSIVKAIRMGRRIYDNLRKAMGFIVAVHIPIAGLALLPLLAGMPFLIGPIHIAFLEMIIDPVCSLAFEAEVDEEDLMERPPRQASTPLFSRWLVAWSVVQGLAILAVTAGLTLYFRSSGMAGGHLRAAAFVTLVLGITSLILINRRFGSSIQAAVRRPNPALGKVLGGVAVILVSTQLIAPVADLFAFARITFQEIGVIVTVNVLALIALERAKRVWGGRLLE